MQRVTAAGNRAAAAGRRLMARAGKAKNPAEAKRIAQAAINAGGEALNASKQHVLGDAQLNPDEMWNAIARRAEKAADDADAYLLGLKDTANTAVIQAVDNLSRAGNRALASGQAAGALPEGQAAAAAGNAALAKANEGANVDPSSSGAAAWLQAAAQVAQAADAAADAADKAMGSAGGADPWSTAGGGYDSGGAGGGGYGGGSAGPDPFDSIPDGGTPAEPDVTEAELLEDVDSFDDASVLDDEAEMVPAEDDAEDAADDAAVLLGIAEALAVKPEPPPSRFPWRWVLGVGVGASVLKLLKVW